MKAWIRTRVTKRFDGIPEPQTSIQFIHEQWDLSKMLDVLLNPCQCCKAGRTYPIEVTIENAEREAS